MPDVLSFSKSSFDVLSALFQSLSQTSCHHFFIDEILCYIISCTIAVNSMLLHLPTKTRVFEHAEQY